MKRLVALFLLLALSVPAGAIDDGQVLYVGGTVANLKSGVIGRLDTTSETNLSFDYSDGSVRIPYANVVSFWYQEELARHLGVLPAIAVGLVKARQRKHFLRITYRDSGSAEQVALFEVSKQMAPTLLAVLHARAPQSCFEPSFGSVPGQVKICAGRH
jgi:hypothetical protein